MKNIILVSDMMDNEYPLPDFFDKEKIAIVLDHYTPCKDIASANLCATARAFAKKHGITTPTAIATSSE